MLKHQEALLRAEKIKVVVFDVDGVLSDGHIYMGLQGEAMKAFSARDGMGITLLHRAGIKTAIITGRQSEIVANRARELKITRVWQGCSDKREAWEELKQELQVKDEEIAYAGDDLNDLPLLLKAGLAATVADAVPEVSDAAQLQSSYNGGQGAVREIAEFILKRQNKWQQLVEGFTGPQKLEAAAQ